MSQTKAQLIDNLVQPITGALGSASAPTFSFTADPNTGLFSPGADQLSLSTGGTGRLFVDASGRVGVGTASPGDKLTVYDTNGSITFGNSSVTEHKLNWDAGSVVLQADPANLNASSSIQFKVDATERARIDSSGRLGVGVSAPSAVLHVASTGAGIQEVQWLRNGQSVAADIGSALVFTGTTNDNGLARISGAFAGAATTDGAYMAFSTRAVTTGTLTERMRITAGGSVGIGTSSPAELVHLLSGSGSDCFLRLNSTSSANNSGIRWQSGGVARGIIASDGAFGGSTADFGILAEAGLSFYTNGTTTKRMVLDTSGRVGIGTTSPADGLGYGTAVDVRGSGTGNGGVVYLRNSDASVTGFVAAFGDGRMDVGTSTNHPLKFITNSNERCRVDTSGRLLVGTSSAQGQSIFQAVGNSSASTDPGDIRVIRGLSVSSIGSNVGAELGIIRFGALENSVCAQISAVCDANWSANDTPGRLVFSTTADGASSPTERMRISNSGILSVFNDFVYNFRTAQAASASNAGIDLTHSSTNIGNGTLSFRVWTNGNVVNTNSSYGAISDLKLKENIVDASSQWQDIKALKVRKYNFKKETNQQTHTQIGLIAQEVELVSPGLVSESPDRDAEGNDLGTTTKSVQYSVLYMKAVKALQEAMERIEQLETEKTEQQTVLDDLLARVTALEAQ